MAQGRRMEAFLSLALRVLVNLESLNMAESVGNVVRHRKAPIVIKTEEGYRMIYVPVISGMSLAHHYQRHLATAASDMGLPVTRMSLLGYFMKFADNNIIENYYNEVYHIIDNINNLSKLFNKIKRAKKSELPDLYDKIGKIMCNIEKDIITNCTVADVGGFLYTNGKIKRTSRFSFTYLAPALESLEEGAAGVLPQLHTRYTPGAREGEQALYYVDTGSALYTLTYTLEASRISKLDTCPALNRGPSDLGSEERAKRFQASYKALIAMLGNMAFGAKRSRSQPHWVVDSIIVVAGTGLTPFIPTPGHYSNYMTETVKRIKTQKEAGVLGDHMVAYYVKPGSTVEEPGEGEEAGSVEEAIAAAAKWLAGKL